MGFNLEVLCEKHTCLMEPELINVVNQNSDNLGWTATNYTEFWGKRLEEGITLKYLPIYYFFLHVFNRFFLD